jgi:alkylation response protein AidB-like acyl-CoA dehydrogenase
MEFDFSPEDEAFRVDVQQWMAEHLVGEFATLGTGSDMGEGAELETRRAWERELASGGWVGMGWPAEYGGRDLSLTQLMTRQSP